MAMNSYLLGMEKDNEAQTLDRTVRCVAGALDKFEVPSGSILHRTAGFSELRNYMGDEKAIAKYGKLAKAGKSEKLAEILDLRLTGTQTNRKTFISTTAASDFKMIEHSKITTKYYVGEGVKGIFIAPDKDLCEFSGEYEPARRIHHMFAELYSLLFVDGNPAGVKALLSEMGFIENELRLPLVPTRIATMQQMADILKKLQL